MSTGALRRIFVFGIVVSLLAVSIVPVSSLNVEKIDMESVESLQSIEPSIDTTEEQSNLWSYDDVHNPDIGKSLLDPYDDFDRELYEGHSEYYRHHMGNYSDYFYGEPFSHYPNYEDFRDVHRHRFENEYVENHTFKDRKPTPKPNFVDGKTWYVDDDGGADFTRIQDAIDAASDGDTVFVYSGIYHENVVVDKSIILEGENRDTAVIDGSGDIIVIIIFAAQVTISGFIIKNSQCGMYLSDSSNNNTINRNTITNNTEINIYLEGSSNNNINENTITNSGYDCILLDDSSNNLITGNIISNNDGDGIYMVGSSNNSISENNISNNYYGIDVRHSSNNSVSGNNIINNDWGIYLWLSFYNTISECDVSSNFLDGLILRGSSDNIISDCIIRNHVLSGICLEDSSDNIIQDCCISENWRGVQIDSESTFNMIKICFISNNHWAIKLANSSLNMIEKCTIMDNVAGVMRGINNTVQSNNFINNKIYHAFGGQEHKNVWNGNHWSGHNTPFPCYLYGFNVDWFPSATRYNYPTSCDIQNDHSDNLWDWDDNTLIERQEELDNRFNLKGKVLERLSSFFFKERDVLNSDTPGLSSWFDEHILSHYFLDVNEYMSDLWRDKR